MSRRWIRLDVGWDTSDWLVELEPAAQLAWVKLLAWVKVHGKAGRTKAMSAVAAGKKWGIQPSDVTAMLEAAQGDHPKALAIVDGEWVVTAWATYQEPDPTAARRKRDQRARDSHGMSRTSRRDTRDTGRDPSRDHRPPTETASPDGDARTRARADGREAGREPGSSLDPERPWDGLDDLTVASLRGLYGGPGRVGTDEAVWRHANGIDRELALKTALIRWRGENHARLNQRLFRKILEAVITEQSQHSPTEKLWT